MVLVVVTVLAVPTHGVEVFKPVKPAPQDLEVAFVCIVIDGVGLGLTHHGAGSNLVWFKQADGLGFGGAERNQVLIGHIPEVIAPVDEVLEPDKGELLVVDHVGAPVFEALNPPDPNFGGVDVDPVVGEEVLTLDDQADDQKVAKAETGGGCLHRLRSRGIHGFDQRADRHGRNQGVAGLGALRSIGPSNIDRAHPPALVLDPNNARLHVGLDAM